MRKYKIFKKKIEFNKINILTPLKKKIRCNIEFVVQKFEDFEKNSNCELKEHQKILILDFESGLVKPIIGEADTLTEVFGKEYFKKLEKDYRITIWDRNYFK